MNKIYNVLGLAFRAGKLVSGDEGVMKAIRSGEAKLVILAEDASANAKKKVQDKCAFYEIPLILFGGRAELGACHGKNDRVVVAIKETGFAELVRRAVQNLAR